MQKTTADKILADLREGYRSAAIQAAATREWLFGGELDRFVDYARERETVLDVGCGDGRDFAIFKEKGVAYAGVDLSADAIAAARERWKGEATFEQGDVLALPVPSGRYDVVMAAGVLQHVPSDTYRRQAFHELARVTRPGGYVLIAVLNFWRPRFWIAQLHQGFGLRNGWDFGDLKISWKKPLFPRYHRAYTTDELGRLCRQAGLEVVEYEHARNGSLIVVARKR